MLPLLLGLLLLFHGYRARAALIAYDGFDYPAHPPGSANSPALNGGTGWSGAWYDPIGSVIVEVAPASLAYRNLATAGRSLAVTVKVASLLRQLQIQSRPDLVQSGGYGKDGTEVWFSTVILPNGNQAVRFASPGSSQISIGYGVIDAPGATPGFGLWGFSNNKFLSSTNSGVQSGQATFLVARFRFNAGATDAVDLWVNPTPGAPLGLPFASLAGFDLSFYRLDLRGGQYDEFRLGDTFADVAPTTDVPQESNANWDPRFGGIGPGFTVLAMVADGTNVVAGGVGLNGPGVARWDGSTWRMIQDGLSQGEVRALLVNGTDLYCGGSFSVSGQQAARGIARWSNDHWEPVGGGVKLDLSADAAVNSLTLHNGRVVAGGRFDSADGSNFRNVAQWDGSSWKGFGTGLGVATSVVRAVSSWKGSLYAGGRIAKAADGSEYGLARWNGTSWSLVGTGFRSTDTSRPTSVEALGVWNDRLHVGGRFDQASGVVSSNVISWDGTSFKAMEAGLRSGYRVPTNPDLNAFLPAVVKALVPMPDGLLAGGFFSGTLSSSMPMIAKWDGTAWTAMGLGIPVASLQSPTNWNIAAAAVTGGRVYVGGTFVASQFPVSGTVTAGAANNAAVLDGHYWKPLRSSIAGSSATSDDHDAIRTIEEFNGGLAVGGVFEFAGSEVANGIAFWDGSRFRAMGSNLRGSVDSLKVHDGELYAAGSFFLVDLASSARNVRWDGAQWVPMTQEPSTGPYRRLVRHRGQLYGMGFTEIYAWRNGQWELIGAANGEIRGCEAMADGLYVGGKFSSISVGPENALASASGQGITCLAASPDGRRLAIGGYFGDGAGKSSVLSIWDGLQFTSLAARPDFTVDLSTDPFVEPVTALYYSGTELFVGGEFLKIRGQSIARLARWDGVAWWPLGSGIVEVGKCFDPSGCIRIGVLHPNHGALVAGGRFTYVGGKPANGFAMWHPAPKGSRPTLTAQDVTVSENSKTGAVFALELNRASTVPVQVFYRLEGITAAAGADFTARQATATIPAGQTRLELAAAILNDTIVEGPETFRLALLGVDNAELGRDEVTATIEDDDEPGILLTAPVLNDSTFEVRLPKTDASRQYVLLRKLDLAEPEWQVVATVPGNGGAIELTDPSHPPLRSVYRVREDTP